MHKPSCSFVSGLKKLLLRSSVIPGSQYLDVIDGNSPSDDDGRPVEVPEEVRVVGGTVLPSHG